MCVEFEDGFFDEHETKEILDIVENLSHEMFIDKSYVECSENLRKSTFMLKSGWESLCNIMLKTNFGKNMHPKTQESVVDAFSTIACCYIYECLSCYSHIKDKISHVTICVDQNCDFEVVVCIDKSNDWKKYLGKWQQWEFDNEGHFLSSNMKSK